MPCDECNRQRVLGHRFCAICGSDLSKPNDSEPCPYCRLYKENGERFCGVCGYDLSSIGTHIGCAKCEESLRKGYGFCRGCGRKLPGKESRRLRPTTAMAGIVMFAILSVLAVELVTGYVKLPFVLDRLYDLSYPIYIITPAITDLFDIGGILLQTLFVAELIIVTVSIGYMVYRTYSSFGSSKKDYESIRDTPLFDIALLNGLLLVFQVAYVMICMRLGISLDSIEFDDVAKSMFSLMHASVYEEFLCRICMLGLPIAFVMILTGRNDVPAYRYLLGGFGFERWMIVFVIFSAVMFGAGHLTNWGTWKFIPTFLFGLLTAYLFIRYGVYASITLHFLTDYNSAGEWLTGDPNLTIALILLIASLLALSSVPHYVRKLKGFACNMVSSQKRG
ncbi:MAG: zinc ribbon domain-containing protein [Candidatus Methanomethylophilaceae archaeon]|nr:zinc ribbon domain-containing protein [Candidatus Methanomethylophilaceae archaeon]